MNWTFVGMGHAPWLVLLPLGLALTWWWQRRARDAVQQQLGRREALLLGDRCHERSRRVLAAVSVAAFAIALLGPVAPGNEARLAPDMVLCVDVSRSMSAGDLSPSRFAAMRAEVHALIAAQRGSRMALLAFAGEVQPVAPLTADCEAIGWLLDELHPGTLRGGTDLGAAIAVAAAMLDRAHTVGDIVLLTDGEDFGNSAARAADAARQQGHRVHCVGFGSSGGSKIVVDGGDGQDQSFLRDAAGNDVVTRIDVAGLQALAAAGGGSYVPGSSPDALFALWRDDLQPYAARQRIADGGPGSLPRFQWPLLVGVLLMMLRMCLSERRR